MPRPKKAAPLAKAKSYQHTSADSPLRPDVGTQAQFRKRKAPQTYRYDSSLSPALDWDGQNAAREQGEALLRQVLEAATLEDAKAAAAKLRALGRPFLNWAGKAERLSFDVPTLPLFVHERLSTKAIIETLIGHRRQKEAYLDLFADPRHSIADQVLSAYEHRDRWVNRMVLGDSLVVMNSLLHYEGLGGQVQMIYMDPPYGVRFGSIVPHVTLKSIANNEPPAEEVLVDRPEISSGITRVTGPFAVEATIPVNDSPQINADERRSGEEKNDLRSSALICGETDRLHEVLRKSPVQHVAGNQSVTPKNVRRPAKSLTLAAEALVDATATGQAPSLAEAVQEAREKSGQALAFSQKAVAFVFGPENGAVSEKLVYEAAREAHGKSYTHLYVIGFAIEAKARSLVEQCAEVVGVPATYVQATPDLLIGDLLKNMRSSQIFSVCGLSEIKIHRKGTKSTKKYQGELLGLDVFDPVTMEPAHVAGKDVPCWLLDTDYSGLCFHVCQAFFPRTGAWEGLKKALRGEYDETVWDHLAGTMSAPFEAGPHAQVAVKVIDDRGNELLVVKGLGAAADERR
jgi:hypothetical protein